MARPTIPPETFDAVCEGIASGLTVLEACEAAFIGETTFRRYRKSDPELQAKYEAAYEARGERIEKEFNARAMNRDDPDSAKIGMFLLRGYLRHRFGEKLQIDATFTAIDASTARRVQELAAANPDMTVGEAMRALEAGG